MAISYCNPVYRGPCADPFVLKHRGDYWCYSTGFAVDGRCFPILRSHNLIDWREMSGAMEPLSVGWPEYWAPEVVYDNGRFLLYYSVGDGVRMHIRVAVSDHAGGPFVDSGHQLTRDEFAIDGHVFEDDDGSRYLFYATDFLTHSHIGTGTVCDRMIDAFTLAGKRHRVSLARYDWHVFDPKRAEKGGVRWHTLEGLFVLKHKGRYYQMFSAGNWKDGSYGVSYAVADSISEADWRQAADGQRVLPILRTIPGKVLGPGHNSVVRGPDNQQLFCVYHRWSEEQKTRVLAIDRLEWIGDRLEVLGASTTPQPAPIPPALEDFVEGRLPALKGWKRGKGKWRGLDGEARQESNESQAEARVDLGAPYFVLEISLRALEGDQNCGALGAEMWNLGGAVPHPRRLPSASRLRRAFSRWGCAPPGTEERPLSIFAHAYEFCLMLPPLNGLAVPY